MCGRFSLGKNSDEIMEYFENHFDYDITQQIQMKQLDKFSHKYNIPPTTNVLSIRFNSNNKIEYRGLRWGLVPSWSKGIDNRFKMNNARADTISTKPAFRLAFKQKRCLILTDGFYEWQKVNNTKQAWYITRNDRKLFTFAGIWDQWLAPDQSTSIESCSIITTEANTFMTSIHDRMPVIISSTDQKIWLDSAQHKPLLQSLLTQSDYSVMKHYPVSNKVNSPRNDSAELTQKITF